MTELTDRNDYLSAGVHIGMRMKTKGMAPFIFKTRPDGLSVLDIEKTDERIKIAAKFLAPYKDIMVVCRKANGAKPVKKFAEVVGAKAVTGRFLPGTLSNPNLDYYTEPDVIIVTDPIADKQAVKEAADKRIPIVAICDTYNDLEFVDLVIPANNKGKKSLGLIYYLLAREILKARGEIKKNEEFKYTLDEFTEKE
ncbi:MAG TPA: 30S ribosomal protein S2 [Candidatus Aenigmarchaeota archaeon]|nr:30S ribosomal protein S2 [Candidatus Aenigmarchaeota archaeon]